MSFLTDNPIVNFFGNTFNKFRLVGLLVDDIFAYMFPPLTTGKFQKYLYLLGVYFMASKIIEKSISMFRQARTLAAHISYQYRFDPFEFRHRYGEKCWALVTGFSSGIGFAYACQLARFGFDLVLIDKDEEKARFAERWVLQRNPSIKTKVIILDLTASPADIRRTLETETQNIDVGLLINNAGMTCGGEYVNVQKKQLIDCYKVNVRAVVEITRHYMDHFRKRGNKSAIINICSGIGEYYSPGTGIYPATKRFTNVFGNTLHKEQGHIIDILSVKPFGVLTGMMGFRKDVNAMALPTQVVYRSFYELRHETNTFGALQHKMAATFLGSLPEDKMHDVYMASFKK